jgi:hypothetical protein
MRLHNKSQDELLAILRYTDAEIAQFEQILLTRVHKYTGNDDWWAYSPCFVTNATDGRFSVASSKICYGYQIVAFAEYGRETIQQIAAAKYSHDYTISHLCGKSNCCSHGHTILEPKQVNDERVHCHFVLKNIVLNHGLQGVMEFKRNTSGWCPHYPECGDCIEMYQQ